MNRAPAALLSLAVGASAIAGVTAVHNSIALGGGARQTTTAAQVARRSAQLDRYQASLVAALAKRPPRLPALPTLSADTRTAAPVRVLYQRAPAIVVARSGGEHEDEEEVGDD